MKPLLITVGEPAGIGPDCIIRAFNDAPGIFEGVIIVAPVCWLLQRAGDIGIAVPIQQLDKLPEPDCSELATEKLNCWNPVPDTVIYDQVSVGETSSKTATAVIRCIESAAHACLNGHAGGMVTGPIEKAVLRNYGFEFPGHTEFLAHISRHGRTHADEKIDFVMMLASNDLRVALLTTHMALRNVPDALSIQATVDSLRIIHHDIQNRFGINNPRLGLCSLNPHAGEQGHFGHEEIDILEPAVNIARIEGMNVTGPWPADTIFSAPMRKNFDVIICCYHDQALIPIKALSFGKSVNVTLGLPFIRTSVDHGTALARAGSDQVSYSSLVAAIRMARQMAEKSAVTTDTV
jgi:4-hydroxythreonine-4-phosphate dehydrogenase